MADEDVTRRTRLAAERTWLAWWRTALGSAVAALAVGRLAPELLDARQWPFAALGAGYGLLAVAMFALGERRRRDVDTALARGGYAILPDRVAAALGAAGATLALATIVLLFVDV